jgi:hypothetical protein
MIHTHLQTNDHRPSTVAHQVHGDVMCGLRTWIVDLCNFIRHHHAVCLLFLSACHVSCVFPACNLIRHHHAVCLLCLSACHVFCVFSACYNLIRRHSMSPICLPASYDAPHVAETSTQYKKLNVDLIIIKTVDVIFIVMLLIYFLDFLDFSCNCFSCKV